MGTDKVGVLFRVALVLFLFCLINLLFVQAGQPEFYILMISLLINIELILFSVIKLIAGRKHSKLKSPKGKDEHD